MTQRSVLRAARSSGLAGVVAITAGLLCSPIAIAVAEALTAGLVDASSPATAIAFSIAETTHDIVVPLGAALIGSCVTLTLLGREVVVSSDGDD